MSEKELQDKVAIITAGSRGIGKSVAINFIQNGAKVVIASRNKYGDLDKTAEELKIMGGDVLAVPTHMGKRDEIANLIEKTLEKFDKIDILYNGAATNPAMSPFPEVEESIYDHIMNVTLKGPFLLAQQAAKEMIKQKSGCIINLASIDGIRPIPNLAPYCVAKAGLIMLTLCLAKELGPYGIRVNTVAPGLIHTDASKALWGNKDMLAERLSITPLQRIGEPEEIANVILFLASDKACYMTGQTIAVDGGRII